MLKLFVRILLFLAILFAVLYVGMTNTGDIPFQCPLLFDKPIKQPAAIIFFAMFAVGVVAGSLLISGGGKKSSKGSPKD